MKNSETQSLTRTRAQLSAELADLDQLFSALYNRCSREQLLWRPGAGSWCIAECIEHVARGISQYLAPMRQAILKGGPSAREENYLFAPGGWFSAAFLRRIGPQVTVKFKAPRKIRPLQVDPEKAFDELRRGHREAQELLSATEQLDLNRTRFKNPFVPVLRFTVATGFLILAAHGRRHLLQAERVPEADAFPKTKAQQSA
ncbi:MAG TPA: DinB family protein [Terriglobales bacterium]|jgi:hypothetical protein|nr:DinB family protein [Terriglobales bacterium]